MSNPRLERRICRRADRPIARSNRAHGRHNVDPDDTYNDVPYEKGCAFLYYVREVVR